MDIDTYRACRPGFFAEFIPKLRGIVDSRCLFSEINGFTGFVKDLFIYFAQKHHCQKKDYCATYQKVVDIGENILYY
ncbi:MAG: hypothetical protein LUH42_03030, partial [Oscillospiraceae bacterium]|nr:hypothetical protein [Oscillospiraceae bacterium]